MKHTMFAIASVLLLSAMFLSLVGLGREAADEEVRGARMSSAAPIAPPAPAPGTPPVRRRSARDSSASWRLTDRLGLGLRVVPRACCSCVVDAGIVIYMMVQGIRYIRPELFVTPPAAGFTESETGGFLDPLIGTIIVGADGDGDRAAARDRDRRLAERVRAPVRAGARRRVRRRDARRLAVDRARAVRRADLPESRRWRSSAAPPATASSTGDRSSPRRRCCRSSRFPIVVAQRPRGAAGDPRPRARGRRTRSARRRSRRPAASCCRLRGRRS